MPLLLSIGMLDFIILAAFLSSQCVCASISSILVNLKPMPFLQLNFRFLDF